MTDTVRLLEAEPDLGARLTSEERELAARIVVPAMQLDRASPVLDVVLEDTGSFAALVLDGLVSHNMTIGDRSILRLLGPGDIIVHGWSPRSGVVGESSKRAREPTRIALLGDALVRAARYFPELMVGLHAQLGEQHQRLAVQMGICQLPRVDDRVLSLMWLLAETWGRVTSSGTVLPLRLTHEAIGKMVGAQRPTVSLALRELAGRNVLVHQDGSWLLLQAPPQAESTAPDHGDVRRVAPAGPQWRADAEPAVPGIDRELLVATVRNLRASHRRIADQVAEGLADARRQRDRSAVLREQIAGRRLNRRGGPSSRPRP